MATVLSSQNSAIVSLICSCLSFISTTSVVGSILIKEGGFNSNYLKLVFRLLVSDAIIAFLLIFYYGIQTAISDYDLQQFCKVYLPTLLYFFMASFGWTIMLAFRFRESLSNTAATKDLVTSPRLPVPLYIIWVISFVIVLPILVANFATEQGISNTAINSADQNQHCTFDHHQNNVQALVINILCFQVQIVATVIVNIYVYMGGLLALRSAPHSVMARQMKRVGGYLAVLIIVWFPTLLYNFFAFTKGSNSSFPALLDFSLCLTSLQGFLNVCVYIWGNKVARIWITRNLLCIQLFMRFCARRTSDDVRSSNQSPRNSGTAPSEPIYDDQSFDNTEYDEKDKDSQTMDNDFRPSENPIMKAILDKSAHTDFPRPKDYNPSNESSYNSSNLDTFRSLRLDMSDLESNNRLGLKKPIEKTGGGAKAPASPQKGILTKKNNKKKSKNIAMGERMSSLTGHLDDEKFVRFGETDTRTISIQLSPSSLDIASRIPLDDEGEDDRAGTGEGEGEESKTEDDAQQSGDLEK